MRHILSMAEQDKADKLDRTCLRLLNLANCKDDTYEREIALLQLLKDWHKSWCVLNDEGILDKLEAA